MKTTSQTLTGISATDPDKQDAAFEPVGSGATSGYGGSSDLDEDDEDELGDDFPEDDMDAEDDLPPDDDDVVLEGEPLDDDVEDDLDDDL